MKVKVKVKANSKIAMKLSEANETYDDIQVTEVMADESVSVQPAGESIEEIRAFYESENVEPSPEVVDSPNKAELEQRIVLLQDLYELEMNKTKRRIPWRNYLAYLMVITMFISGVTAAKYVSQIPSKSTATIASFNVSAAVYSDAACTTKLKDVNFSNGEVTLGSTLNFTAAGQTQSYYLKVTNNSDVTIAVTCALSGASQHTLSSGAGPTQVGYGESKVIELQFKAPTMSSTETGNLTITATQVD